MTIEARRVHRGVSGALLALALVLLAAVPVAQADTIYPDNKITGTSFDQGLDGWTEFSNQCFLVDLNGSPLLDLGAPQPLCAPHTTHSAGHGTPPGSLEQVSDQTASAAVGSLLGVIRGQASALSPEFTVPATGPATFTVDRRFQLDALLPLGLITEVPARFAYNFFLVDSASPGTPFILDGDTVDVTRNTDPPFSGHGPITLPAGTVQAGHKYRLQVTTTFKANPLTLLTAVAALYTAHAQYDNVRLRIADGTPTFGRPTVHTDPADPIGTDTATLNGTVNAQGNPTTFQYRISQDPTLPNTAATTTLGPFNGGSQTEPISRPRQATGLLPCKTYTYRIEASNSVGAATTDLTPSTFTTDCFPTAITRPADYGSTTATLTSEINPNGADTIYLYQYGLDSNPQPDGFDVAVPANPPFPSVGSGRTPVIGNPVVISGLLPKTKYRARVIAVNAVNSAFGNIVTFTTDGTGETGPVGPPGAQGNPGATGAPGANGTNGTNGAPGPAGPPGARGPAGAQGTSGSSLPDADSSSRLAMIRIDATTISVPMRGRNIGRVRVRVFCRRIAVRTCSGNLKVRSLNPILPNSFGLPKKPKRRVTFATDAVQLDVGKVGFAILNFNAQRRSVLKREGRVRATVIITVIDANNNRQNVRKVVTVVRGSNS